MESPLRGTPERIPMPEQIGNILPLQQKVPFATRAPDPIGGVDQQGDMDLDRDLANQLSKWIYERIQLGPRLGQTNPDSATRSWTLTARLLC